MIVTIRNKRERDEGKKKNEREGRKETRRWMMLPFTDLSLKW